MVDIIEKIEGSIIQHGPHNNRIYLMKFNTSDTHSLIAALDDIALENGYGKIFAKIPSSAWNSFKSADYIKEAVIPGLYKGKTDGFFVAKYFSARRQKAPNVEKQLTLFKNAGEKLADNIEPASRANRDIVSCKPSDAEEMSAIYRQVFKSYPFPIQKRTYLKRMMKAGVLYFCIRIEGRIVAIAAAEIDLENKNVEMTDFATIPKLRGEGLASTLLSHMEEKILQRGIQTAYTIARAASHGMNTVFKNNGYNYAGFLKNNSQICGSIQSMTVWYKQL